jgi:hypothetical protein
METFQRALMRITSTDCACPTCATRVTPTVAIAVNPTSRPYTPAQAFRNSDILFALATALWDADPYYGCDLIRRLVDLCAEVTVDGRALAGRRDCFDDAKALRWPGRGSLPRHRAQPKRPKSIAAPFVVLFADLAVAATEETHSSQREDKRR